VNPPTLRGLGLFGRPFDEVPEYLRAISREYGPFVRFKNPWRTYYFTDDAAYIEEVLVTKSPAFMKGRGTQRLQALLGKGLLTAVQPEHIKHRRLVQPAFHKTRIDACASIVVASTLGRISRWRAGEIVELHQETMELALEIVARALFGSDLSGDMTTIARALNDALEQFPAMLRPFSEIFDHVPTRGRLRFWRGKRDLDRIVYRLMEEHRRDGRDLGDLLSMLIESREADGERLSESQIRDEALTILLAGHETTANAMSWTFYLLQRHPDVEEKLRAHVDAVLGGRDATLEDFNALDYVRAVVSESMRLYPPAWLTGRKALMDTTIGPYPMKKNEFVLVSQYVTHRNARYWRDPDTFDPDRWKNGAPKERFAYFPFGGGNRLCIGERFAWLEAVLAIATIVQRVRLERVDEGDVNYEPLVTLRPAGPVRAKVAER